MTMPAHPTDSRRPGTIFGRSPMAAYIGPVVVFGVLTALEDYVPASWYGVAYAVKAVAVTASLVLARRIRTDIHPTATVVLPAVVTGLVMFVAWLAIERIPYPHLSERVAFNPFESMQAPGVWAFLGVRLYGLVVMVPIMEELFWRSFLLKYVSDLDLDATPPGQFTTGALWTMIGLSAIAHQEWLAGAAASGVYALLLVRTRSLFATVLAHAVTNAALGVYILVAGEWQLW